MKDKSLLGSTIAILLFLGSLAVGIAVDSYLDYHAKMHCAYTWGIVTDTHAYSGKHHSSVIQYKLADKTYECFMNPISSRYLGDSVIVAYDTTRYKRSFVPTRNPRDAETAFFKSEQRYLGMKWHSNLEKYKRNLAARQEEHRRREHFYDYFCRDDH